MELKTKQESAVHYIDITVDCPKQYSYLVVKNRKGK